MSVEFNYGDLLPIGVDKTEFKKISDKGLKTFTANGKEFLEIAPETITELTEVAMHDISHYLRAEHLSQLQMILDDPESSGNDRFVALDLLKNANISAGGVVGDRLRFVRVNLHKFQQEHQRASYPSSEC